MILAGVLGHKLFIFFAAGDLDFFGGCLMSF